MRSGSRVGLLKSSKERVPSNDNGITSQLLVRAGKDKQMKKGNTMMDIEAKTAMLARDDGTENKTDSELLSGFGGTRGGERRALG